MEYNDFPILNDDEYKLLQDKYNNLLPFDRLQCVNLIYSSCVMCEDCCYTVSAIVNPTIRQSVKQCLGELNKISSNLLSTFNLKPALTHELKSVNLFNFLKKLINLLKNLQNWCKNEEKEYFKSLAFKSSVAVMDATANILSAIENSNVPIYKHM